MNVSMEVYVLQENKLLIKKYAFIKSVLYIFRKNNVQKYNFHSEKIIFKILVKLTLKKLREIFDLIN